MIYGRYNELVHGDYNGYQLITGGAHPVFWWWLEPWNFEWLSHHIGNVIIPTDELIFFREVGMPPTSIVPRSRNRKNM